MAVVRASIHNKREYLSLCEHLMQPVAHHRNEDAVDLQLQHLGPAAKQSVRPLTQLVTGEHSHLVSTHGFLQHQSAPSFLLDVSFATSVRPFCQLQRSPLSIL